jgi:6-pyruvoyltetrahydropterin/6-carboxytetrahydropterin synthase
MFQTLGCRLTLAQELHLKGRVTMEICKSFTIDAAHTVLYAFTKKCDRTNGGGIHGHTYKINVYLRSETLDHAGMVVDFTKVKMRLEDFIDSFDHSLLIYASDSLLSKVGRMLSARYVLLPYNPTAELMALHFYLYIGLLLNDEFGSDILSRVDVYETATSFATATQSDMDSLFSLVNGETFFSPAVASTWKHEETRKWLKVDTFDPSLYEILILDKLTQQIDRTSLPQKGMLGSNVSGGISTLDYPGSPGTLHS